MHEIGAVHGRFQPFHLEHLEYVSRAFEESRQLFVGVTHSDPTHARADRTAPHRHLAEANPFPYWMRQEMIIGSLEEAGYDVGRVRVVPFPIDRPDLIPLYVPFTAVHLLSPCDEWQEEKIKLLTSMGYRASYVITSRKTVNGTEIRALLKAGAPIHHLVPAFVDRYLAATRAATLVHRVTSASNRDDK